MSGVRLLVTLAKRREILALGSRIDYYYSNPNSNQAL